MYPLEIGADMGLVVPAWTLVDPLGVCGGGESAAGVPAVLLLGGSAEVPHPVVCGVAVLVVQGFWEPASVVEPNQPVGHVILLGNPDPDVTTLIRRASRF